MKYKKLLITGMLVPALSGCVTYQDKITTPKKNYSIQATRDLDQYFFTNSVTFGEYALGKKFTGSYDSEVAWPETGGKKYATTDKSHLFSAVFIITDEYNEIVEIFCIKENLTPTSALNLILPIVEVIEGRYRPAAFGFSNINNYKMWMLFGAKSSQRWIESYSSYLKDKDDPHYHAPAFFDYIIHPLLSEVTLTIAEKPSSSHATLMYKSLRYWEAVERQKKKTHSKFNAL